MQAAETSGRLGRSGAAAFNEILHRTDGCQDDRQAQLVPEKFGPAVHVDDVAEDARAKPETIQRQAVSPVRCLRLGRAHEVVPATGGKFLPRRGDELMHHLD